MLRFVAVPTPWLNYAFPYPGRWVPWDCSPHTALPPSSDRSSRSARRSRCSSNPPFCNQVALIILRGIIPKRRFQHQRKKYKVEAERLESGGPCWLLKMSEWGLKEYKWKVSVLGWFFGLFVPVQEIFVLPLGCSSRPSTKYFFPHRTLFQFLCPNRSASWAGSRAGSPVSSICLYVGGLNVKSRSGLGICSR
jgi:hypothetical protein